MARWSVAARSELHGKCSSMPLAVVGDGKNAPGSCTAPNSNTQFTDGRQYGIHTRKRRAPKWSTLSSRCNYSTDRPKLGPVCSLGD